MDKGAPHWTNFLSVTDAAQHYLLFWISSLLKSNLQMRPQLPEPCTPWWPKMPEHFLFDLEILQVAYVLKHSEYSNHATGCRAWEMGLNSQHGQKYFSSPESQTGFWAYFAFYPLGNRSSLTKCKATGMWSQPLTSKKGHLPLHFHEMVNN